MRLSGREIKRNSTCFLLRAESQRCAVVLAIGHRHILQITGAGTISLCFANVTLLFGLDASC